MTNLKDILNDMVRETIMRHASFQTETPQATNKDYDEFVGDIVDEYTEVIKNKLIGE